MSHEKVGTYQNYEFIAALTTVIEHPQIPYDITGTGIYASVRDKNTKNSLNIKRITLIMNAESSNVYHPGWDIANDRRLFCENCSHFQLPLWSAAAVNERFILGDALLEFPDGKKVELRTLRIENPRYHNRSIQGSWR